MLTVKRMSPKGVAVDMPDGISYQLDTAGEANDLLVIVEGDIPTGGLFSGVKVIHSWVLPERLVVPADGAYTKCAECEEEPAHVVWRSHAYHNVRRHAVLFSQLFPTARLLLRRYDISNLRPRYVIVEFTDVAKGDLHRKEDISDFCIRHISP